MWPLDPNFTHVGLRGRETNDSFGALTQSLMWVMTGDEVYRRNAIQALRAWASMNPDGYKYFPDAHIHTGHPLYQFLMAAEIIRATEPADDDTPGEHDGYDVVWSGEDDEHLLTNFAKPLVEAFLYSNEKWMNQHNFGLFGRIATAIYADDAEGYATGVEWFTVNSTFDGYSNGAMAPQMPLIEADDPINPYGYHIVQVREMGRDQAHGETNIDNFAGLARMLEVQATEVDPVHGTVSTADNAVSAYDFLDRRLLAGANVFYGFMMGAWTPWVEERGEGWNGTISQSYRGRIYNMISVAELYYEYAIERGVDVETEAPWLARLYERLDGTSSYYGAGVRPFWESGDKNPEYWVAFPEEIKGTEPASAEESRPSFGRRHSLQLDDRSELVTEDGRTFTRAHVDEQGTTTVVNRLMYGSSRMGLLVRTDGPAKLEVLDKEEPSELNEYEDPPGTIATIELPDTGGEWRYVTYRPGRENAHFYRLTGEDGTTVDLDAITFAADTELTPPVFEQDRDRHYLWVGAESAFDLSAADPGGSVAYEAFGLPTSAALDTETGALTWEPTHRDVWVPGGARPTGRDAHSVQVVADDGDTVAARTFEFVVARNRPKLIDALLDDHVDPDAVYTTVSRERFDAALAETKDAAESGTDEEFRTAFEELRDEVEALELLNPRLAGGALDHRGIVMPSVISDSQVNALADGNVHSHFGDLRVASLVLDFGTRYRVAAEQFGFQARFSFPMRSQGTNVYGSNDGIAWTLLSKRMSSATNLMETIDVVDDQQGVDYRYFKLQVDEPGVPIDPAGPGIWSISEFRIFGERSEVPGTIADVSLTSADALRERVTTGDTAELAFSSAKPISDVAVTIAGEEVEPVSQDGLSWTASTELGAGRSTGPVPITIDHTTEDGETAATVLGTTDLTELYYSDEHNLVGVPAIATVVDASGRPDPGKAGHSQSMFDGNTGTFSDVADAGGEASLIWDLGLGAAVSVDRIDFLARQDQNSLARMHGLVFEGSNDLQHWTRLTEPTFKTLSWQNLPSLDDGAWRYLRVRNGQPVVEFAYYLNIAELRIFGDVRLDLDGVLERADAVDLSPYSRASGIRFTREVEAVRAAAEEPDADRDALADRLLAAWDLLEPPPTMVASIEQSWVTASSESWDGSRDAAANGWAMFDGNLSTFTDTTQSSGWVRVVPAEATTFVIDAVRFHARSGFVSRALGIEFQGSDDGGATWQTFATIGDTPAAGWTEIKLAETVEYGAVRVYAPSGNTNLADVELVGTAVDTTGLDLYLTETETLEESDWTPQTWADLAEAREAGLALRADGASPSQEEIDAAAAALAAAVAGLEPAS